MILPFQEYTPQWKQQYAELKSKIEILLQKINHQIDHIGSTSVKGLSAKPIIDIQIGVDNQADLDLVPTLLKDPNLVYYEKYNADMPTRRFFVLFTKTTSQMQVSPVVTTTMEVPEILHNHNLRIAHIHVFIKGSEDWTRHIAFRDYLKAHPSIKDAYQELKTELVQKEWKDGNHYNEAKDAFLKKHESLAIQWYKNRETT